MPRNLETEADILLHGPPRKQGELLKHHGDPVGAEAAKRLGHRSGSRPRLLIAVVAPEPHPGSTLLRPLTQRSRVDLPDPESPISTQISPRLDRKIVASCHADHVAGLRQDLLAIGASASRSARASARVSARTRCRRLTKVDLGHGQEASATGLLAAGSLAHPIEQDRHQNDRQRPASKPWGDVDRIQGPDHRLAEPALHPTRAAITTIGQGEHDALGQTGHDGRHARGVARPSTAVASLVAPKASPASKQRLGRARRCRDRSGGPALESRRSRSRSTPARHRGPNRISAGIR